MSKSSYDGKKKKSESHDFLSSEGISQNENAAVFLLKQTPNNTGANTALKGRYLNVRTTASFFCKWNRKTNTGKILC